MMGVLSAMQNMAASRAILCCIFMEQAVHAWSTLFLPARGRTLLNLEALERDDDAPPGVKFPTDCVSRQQKVENATHNGHDIDWHAWLQLDTRGEKE
jgi:hypothetical protein